MNSAKMLRLMVSIYLFLKLEAKVLKDSSNLATLSTKPVNRNSVLAVNVIIEKIFLKKFTTTNLILATKDSRRKHYLNDLLNAILIENGGKCIDNSAA